MSSESAVCPNDLESSSSDDAEFRPLECPPQVNILDSSAAFWQFDWDCSGPWVAHVPLIFWLIEALRPRRVAVVGDGARTAFLASCQAVRRLGLSSRVFGAFLTPLADGFDGKADGEGWRLVGTQHRLGAEAARALLVQEPVDFLVLDTQAARFGAGDSAPTLWRTVLTKPSTLVLETKAGEQPQWKAVLNAGVGISAGGMYAVHFTNPGGEDGPAASQLSRTFRDPELSEQLRLRLEHLGSGLFARRELCQARATAERLELALAESAVRGDEATAQLLEARGTIERLEEELGAAAVAAQHEATSLRARLQAVTAEAALARNETASLRARLQDVTAEAALTRNEMASLRARLQDVTAEAALAQHETASLNAELHIAAEETKYLCERNVIVERELAEANGRAQAAEQHLAEIVASTSWRIMDPVRSVVRGRPRTAKLLRRISKLVWWTITLQLPNRYRTWKQIRQAPPPVHLPAPASTDLVAPPTCALFASIADLQEVVGRIESLEEWAAEVPSLHGHLEELGRRALHGHLEELGRRAADLEQACTSKLTALHGHFEGLGRRAAELEQVFQMERARVDWALGSLEGINEQIDAYHAYRETDDYKAAFTTLAPLVSVCVATVDRADLLIERSIASLQRQSYRNLQIIVVGDHCTDDTARRLAALGDSRIHFVNLPERGPYPRPGVDRWCVAGSNAMNHALSLCEGHFVTHLDDDDVMVPHRIETLVGAALQDGADFLWHAFWCEHPDGTWQRLGDGRLVLGQVSTGSIFYHRHFARIQWDVRAYRLHEPGDWNRLRKIKLLRPRLRFVDEPLLYHYGERSQPAFVARQGERFLE